MSEELEKDLERMSERACWVFVFPFAAAVEGGEKCGLWARVELVELAAGGGLQITAKSAQK